MPSERFDDHGDGTVTDRQSMLMWLRCSVGQHWSAGSCVGEAGSLQWVEAQASATEVNRGGTFFFNDWRVPLLRELATITERACANPRINLSVFPGTPAQTYWSSSLRETAGSQALAYTLSFGEQGVDFMDKKESNHVRLVRNAR
jgi:hypothetical protein